MIQITDTDIAHARALRHDLHAAPELSGVEQATARRIASELQAAGADEVLTGLGGTGVAGVFQGRGTEPTVMIRAELDALPITEESGVDWISKTPGTAHLCGHDGHMAILIALARALSRDRPQNRVILLFQPAEEDGAGAKAVLGDPRSAALAPDLVVSLHNLPGLQLGHVALGAGPMGCASRGMAVRLTGRAAHASTPEHGRSPRRALAQLMEGLTDLAEATFPDPYFALVTVAGITMGGTAFGVAPGDGEIRATLRTLTDKRMDRLIAQAEALARQAAQDDGLDIDITYHEVFEATSNDPEPTALLRRALDAAAIPHGPDGQPWRPSEDFGRLSALAPAAMLFLGSGTDQPPLHDPRYDFPDDLIAIGARLWASVIGQIS